MMLMLMLMRMLMVVHVHVRVESCESRTRGMRRLLVVEAQVQHDEVTQFHWPSG